MAAKVDERCKLSEGKGENKMRTPLEYGKLACDMIMKKYSPAQLPPKGVLFYHQGVCLSGMEKIYQLSGEKKYFDYIKAYIDSVIGGNGEVFGIDHEVTEFKEKLTWEEYVQLNSLTMLDCKQPVILMYNLYKETGNEKYKKAIQTISESMYYWPINNYGGYWHMMTQHQQMWLDGAYMAGPFSVLYSNFSGDGRLRERAIQQVFIMHEHMKDEKSGLYFHGWDPSHKTKWADANTGCSSQIWGRAVGWYAVAILDILENISEQHPAVNRLKEIEADLLQALVKYQDKKNGMWYEVLDKPECEGNWVESSCTNLFIYSYAKALRMGVIGKEYCEVIERAYKGIEDGLYFDENENLVIDRVCIGTCIDEGTYEHYINRQQIQNDLHGVGAFVLMCSEMERYRKLKQ